MVKTVVKDSAEALRVAVNGAFANREAWQIVAITTTSVLSAVWVWNAIFNQDESVCQRVKKRVFKLTRKIPIIQARIDEEMSKMRKDFENDMLKNCGQLGYTTKLPFESQNAEEIFKKLEEHLSLGHFDFKNGRVSGAVYTVNAALVDIIKEVYGRASYTNPLHADIFPGVCKMEAEVLRMVANLFHGSQDTR